METLSGRRLSARRQDVARRLFALFNRCAFGARLPDDTPIEWNARLTKTAGLTSYKVLDSETDIHWSFINCLIYMFHVVC